MVHESCSAPICQSDGERQGHAVEAGLPVADTIMLPSLGHHPGLVASTFSGVPSDWAAHYVRTARLEAAAKAPMSLSVKIVICETKAFTLQFSNAPNKSSTSPL